MRITARLWLYMTIIVTLVLVLVWLFLIMLLPDLYYDSATEELSGLSDSLLTLIEDENPLQLSPQGIQRLEEFSARYEMRIELLSPEGDRLYFAGWGRTLAPLTANDMNQIRSGAAEYITKRFPRPGSSDALLAAQTLYYDGEPVAVLSVCLPMAPVEDTLDILRVQLLIVIAISLVISLEVGFLLARSFVRPIKEMEKAALEIARGGEAPPLRLKDRSEIGDLARTLEHMSAQLRQVETMRRQFIATVSHQFKTPLAIIQGHTELIQDSLPPELETRYGPQFSVISDEIRKLDRMARDMMRLSQFESAPATYAQAEVDIPGLFRTLETRFATRTGGVKLHFEAPEGMTVQSSAEALGDVLENLLQNALHHAQAKQITVSASQDGDSGRTLLRVRDDGVGLTPQVREHIWERFYKGDRNDRQGNGLGMAIVKAVLDSLGAEYGIVSAPGEGTEVWILLADDR